MRLRFHSGTCAVWFTHVAEGTRVARLAKAAIVVRCLQAPSAVQTRASVERIAGEGRSSRRTGRGQHTSCGR